MHLWVPKFEINFHYVHYVHVWTLKIKIESHHAFVNFQDQNKP
jgi:hypothetical protein